MNYIYWAVGLLWALAITFMVALLTACVSTPPPLSCPPGEARMEGYCCVVTAEMKSVPVEGRPDVKELETISMQAACVDRTGERLNADRLRAVMGAK